MPLDVVTGAFSYTGRAVAEELLVRGREVRTLSRASARDDDPLRGRIERFPLQFRDVARLIDSLHGAETLYNTYWIRFERAGAVQPVSVGDVATLCAEAGSDAANQTFDAAGPEV